MDVPSPPESAETASLETGEIADPVSVVPPPGAATALPGTGLSDEALIQQIEAQFSGWGVWLSDARRWWAFRTAANPLTIDQLRAGCRLIVQADTDTELRAAIHAEIELSHGGYQA